MPFQKKDDPGVKNWKDNLLVQWNTWKNHQYRTIDDDDDNNDMVITRKDEDSSGDVDGDSVLLLLNGYDQVPTLASKMPSSS